MESSSDMLNSFNRISVSHQGKCSPGEGFSCHGARCPVCIKKNPGS
uniref:Uncharacterized protein n=1 Tax=Manihot esculenta TaxID=3983 RepID=A0A2C9V991_MANES